MSLRFVVDLGSVALGEKADALVRIPLAVVGKFVKGALKFAITRETLRELVENFRKRKTGETVIDYEHASEQPEVAQGQPVPAAGWLKEIEGEPDGKGILWGLAEFTSRAREMIAGKEYKYLSPAIDWGARDKGTGAQQGATLTSVALVNRPFLEALPAIQLSDGWEAAGEVDERKETKMVTKVTLAEGGRGTVVCGECQKETTVEGLQFPKPEGPKVVRLSEVKRDKEGRLDFVSLTELPGGTLIASEVIYAINAQSELDAAVQAGKILPAQRANYEKLALSDLAGFRELVKSLKPQVDLSERGHAGGTGEGGDLRKVDARIDELARAKMAVDKSLTYGQAFKLVLGENHELLVKRVRLMKEGV